MACMPFRRSSGGRAVSSRRAALVKRGWSVTSTGSVSMRWEMARTLPSVWRRRVASQIVASGEPKLDERLEPSAMATMGIWGRGKD